MVEVGIAQLRRELKDWLERAREGEEVIVTDRGTPVARLTGVDGASVIDRLVAEGRLSRPESRDRPDPRAEEPIRPSASVSELIVADRDAKR